MSISQRPGYGRVESAELGEFCDYVTFNSLSQLRRLAAELDRPDQVGLRVNPQLSLVGDRAVRSLPASLEAGRSARSACWAVEAAARASSTRVRGLQFPHQLRLVQLRAAPPYGPASRGKARRLAVPA